MDLDRVEIYRRHPLSCSSDSSYLRSCQLRHLPSGAARASKHRPLALVLAPALVASHHQASLVDAVAAPLNTPHLQSTPAAVVADADAASSHHTSQIAAANVSRPGRGTRTAQPSSQQMQVYPNTVDAMTTGVENANANVNEAEHVHESEHESENVVAVVGGNVFVNEAVAGTTTEEYAEEAVVVVVVGGTQTQEGTYPVRGYLEGKTEAQPHGMRASTTTTT